MLTLGECVVCMVSLLGDFVGEETEGRFFGSRMVIKLTSRCHSSFVQEDSIHIMQMINYLQVSQILKAAEVKARVELSNMVPIVRAKAGVGISRIGQSESGWSNRGR
jgi:hypothetical protein